MQVNHFIVIILDSLGVGELPDAAVLQLTKTRLGCTLGALKECEIACVKGKHRE